MSAKQPDIEQIRRYHNGDLDVHAMHQLEAAAQDDPFLMEALEGYEGSANNQQANFIDLQNRLNKRVAERKSTGITLWRLLPIAASVTIVAATGWFFLSPKKETAPGKRQVVKLQKPAHPLSIPHIRLSPAMLPKERREQMAIVLPPQYLPIKHTHLKHTLLANTTQADSVKTPEKLSQAIARVTDKPAAGLAINEIAVTKYHAENAFPKITGRITDTAGRALPGARIMVKGSAAKITTNSNGEFTLPADIRADSVTVRMIGYADKHIGITGHNNLNIQLQENSITLAGAEVIHKMRPPDIHDAQPQSGWKDYMAYLYQKAIMPDGETGKVKLRFSVDTQGKISNIRIVRGRSDLMNQKAIALVMNGPQWYGSESASKEIKLKIKFHKS